MDLFAYTVGMASATMASFCIPLYTFGHHGVEGVQCDVHANTNDFDYDGCYSLYRARGTMLAFMTISTLVFMVHCRSYREIEWGLTGLKKTIHSQTFNYTLLFDVVTLCIFFYVPNTAIKGFFMMGITWEWGVVIALLVFSIIYGEVYKALKRKFLTPPEAHQLSEFITIED